MQNDMPVATASHSEALNVLMEVLESFCEDMNSELRDVEQRNDLVAAVKYLADQESDPVEKEELEKYAKRFDTWETWEEDDDELDAEIDVEEDEDE